MSDRGRTATFYEEFNWKLENENQRFPLQTSISLHSLASLFNKHMASYFPGSPVVKISPPSARGVGSIPAWGDKILYAPQAKKTKQKPEAIL